MPTTKIKNLEYRLALPLLAPRPGKNPLLSADGHPIRYPNAFLRLIRRHHVLGSATLISDGSQESLLLTRSLRPAHIPDADTFFRVASITKVAVSVVAMRLIEEGYLDLNREVITCLPSSSGLDCLKGITLRHLLSHTSGLTDPPNLENDLNQGKALPEVLSSIRMGTVGRFRYSNLGYGLIGCLLESILRKPVDTVFDEWLFRPLGMHASLGGRTLPAGHIMPISRVFVYHEGRDVILTPLGSRPLKAPDPLRHFGHTAGSMYVDIRSLASLFRMLLLDGNGFLRESSVSEMRRIHAVYGNVSPTLSYGLGLLRIHDPRLSNHDLLGHQGFAYGCVDGAFWEEGTKRMLIFLNGGCSEARTGRLGNANFDMLRWAFRKELPSWS